MQLNSVRCDAALTVDVIEEADARYTNERARLTTGRIETLHELLTDGLKDPGLILARTARVGDLCNHRDVRIVQTRQDEVIIAILLAEHGHQSRLDTILNEERFAAQPDLGAEYPREPRKLFDLAVALLAWYVTRRISTAQRFASPYPPLWPQYDAPQIQRASRDAV